MERRLILLFLLVLPYQLFAQWQKAGSLPSGYVRNLFMTSNGEIYAVGEKSLFWSGNRGENWTKIALPKPFSITSFHQYGTSIFFGTIDNGIYQYEKGKNPEWKSITEKLDKNKLADESLSVGSIISSDNIILADVYHLGHPDFGGSHTRVYLSRDRGETWEEQQLDNSHYKVYSFAFTKGSEVQVATSQGVFRVDVNQPKLAFQLFDANVIAKKIVQVDDVLIGIPDYDYFNALSQNYYNKLFLYDLTAETPRWSTITVNDPKAALGVTDLTYSKGDLFLSTYYGVCKTTLPKVSQNWDLILGGQGNSSFYTSNIKVSEQGNKFITPEIGVKRQLASSSAWSDANTNLEISYIYATHLTNNYLLAVTENGLYRTTTTGNKFEWKAVNTGLTPANRFVETNRAFVTTTQNGEIILGTNNGFARSTDQGETWTTLTSLPVATVVVRGSQVPTKVYFQTYLQDLASLGGTLYALALERLYTSKDGGKTWQVTSITSDVNISIKGLQVYGNELYAMYEKYPDNDTRGHEVWIVPDGFAVQKYSLQTEKWSSLLTSTKKAHIYGFVAHNNGLFFSAKDADGSYTFHGIDLSATNPSIRTITNPLTADDGYVQRFYSRGTSLFLTTINSRGIHVSTDGGKNWNKAVEDPLSTPSTFTISSTHIYAGITGSGVWFRPFSDFFPITASFVTGKKTTEAIADKDAKVTSVPEGKLLVSPNIPGTEVTLFSRSITRDKWTSTKLTSATDTFSIQLPASQFDSVGLEYYVAVLPPAEYRNPAKPIVYTDTVRVALRFAEGLSMTSDLKFGKKKSDYNFISFPVAIDESDAKKVLAEVLDGKIGTDNSVWRLLNYAGLGSSRADAGDPPIWQNATRLEPGVGYWLAIAAEGKTKRIRTSNGTTVVNYQSEDNLRSFANDYFTIRLTPGFNQIGNPFYLNIAWEDVLAATDNPAVGPLITFNRNGNVLERNDKNSVLKPFGGGFVQNSSNETVLLKIPVKRNVSLNGARRSLEKREDEMPFLVDFTLRTESTLDAIAGIGVHPEAQPDKDAWDKVSPPMAGGFPQLRFPLPVGDALSYNVLPVETDGQSWSFEIKGNTDDEEIAFGWDILKQDETKEIWLHDLTAEKKTDMQTVASYSFSGTHRFRIYYGVSSYIEKQLVPETILLKQTYPNPFQNLLTVPFTLPKGEDRYTITMNLLNSVGQRMHEWQPVTYPPGFHELELYAEPHTLATGTYILEMEVAGKSGAKKYFQKIVKK